MTTMFFKQIPTIWSARNLCSNYKLDAYKCTVEDGGKGGEKLWNSVNASIYLQTLYHFDFFPSACNYSLFITLIYGKSKKVEGLLIICWKIR